MKKIKTFEDKILELRSLERKINKAHTRAIKNALFIESKRGAIFYEKCILTISATCAHKKNKNMKTYFIIKHKNAPDIFFFMEECGQDPARIVIAGSGPLLIDFMQKQDYKVMQHRTELNLPPHLLQVVK